MTEFKVGDKVRFLKNGCFPTEKLHGLEEGKIYVITEATVPLNVCDKCLLKDRKDGTWSHVNLQGVTGSKCGIQFDSVKHGRRKAMNPVSRSNLRLPSSKEWREVLSK